MHDDPAIRPVDHTGAGAWWRAGAALSWVGGVALQLQQAALWAGEAYALIVAAALGLGPVSYTHLTLPTIYSV